MVSAHLALTTAFLVSLAIPASGVSPEAGGKTDVIPLLAAAEADAKSITNDSDRSDMLGEVADAKADAGDIIGAQSMIKGLSSDFDKAEALRELAVAQARAGDFAGAMLTAESIPTGPSARIGIFSRGEAWGGIAIAQFKAGDTAGARRSMDQAKIADSGSPGSVLTRIAFAQVKAGDLAGAMDTANNAAVDDSSRLYVLGRIAVARFRLGDTVAVRQILDQMKIIVKVVEHGPPFSVVLLHFAVAQANAGDLAGAETTADSISRDYPEVRVIAWSCIAIAQATAGDQAGARRTLKKAKAEAPAIQGALRREEAFQHLAAAQVKAGDLTGAAATAGISEDSEVKISAWTGIATARADAGAVTKAHQSLRRAQAEGEAIAGVWGKAWVMPWIASACAKTDGLAAARRWIAGLPDPYVRSRCYIQLAKDRSDEGIQLLGDEDE